MHVYIHTHNTYMSLQHTHTYKRKQAYFVAEILASLWIAWEFSTKTTQSANTKTDTAALRGCKTYTCTTENPELGIFQTGKQTNHKKFLEIFMIILKKKMFTYAENLGVQNTPKSYENTPTRLYLWWSLLTLYLHACEVRVTVGDSGLCCCTCVPIFWVLTELPRMLTPDRMSLSAVSVSMLVLA